MKTKPNLSACLHSNGRNTKSTELIAQSLHAGSHKRGPQGEPQAPLSIPTLAAHFWRRGAPSSHRGCKQQHKSPHLQVPDAVTHSKLIASGSWWPEAPQGMNLKTPDKAKTYRWMFYIHLFIHFLSHVFGQEMRENSFELSCNNICVSEEITLCLKALRANFCLARK